MLVVNTEGRAGGVNGTVGVGTAVFVGSRVDTVLVC